LTLLVPKTPTPTVSTTETPTTTLGAATTTPPGATTTTTSVTSTKAPTTTERCKISNGMTNWRHIPDSLIKPSSGSVKVNRKGSVVVWTPSTTDTKLWIKVDFTNTPKSSVYLKSLKLRNLIDQDEGTYDVKIKTSAGVVRKNNTAMNVS